MVYVPPKSAHIRVNNSATKPAAGQTMKLFRNFLTIATMLFSQLAQPATSQMSPLADTNGNILAPLKFFQANILVGSNMVFRTNGGKLEISAAQFTGLSL